jgi:5-methylcytosine-specific restriction endonuclease McrA
VAYNQERYLSNPEYYLAYSKKWKDANKERVRLKNQEYRKAHKEERAALQRKRRAVLKGLATEKYTVQDVIEKYGESCHICNKKINLKAERRSGRKGWEKGLHIDHLIPLLRGGIDTLENVRPAHGLCNLRKGRNS